MEQATLSIGLSDEAKKELHESLLMIANEAVQQATKQVTVNNRFLNQKELMNYFKIGKPVIDDWIAEGLKFVMISRQKVFDMEDVYKFLDDKKI